MQPTRWLKTLAATAAFACSAALAQTAPAKPPIEFNYGIPTADHVTVYVAQDLGLFEKAGLKPKFFNFQSGAPLLAGLKSESLDVVTAGLALTFALGQDIPLKFLFWQANNAAAEGLVVDPKGPVKSYQDIAKSKKIGAATGTCAQVSLYLMAKKAGVDWGKLDVVNVPAPLLRNAFMSGSIDAGVAWPPYSLQLQSEGFPVANFDEDYTPPGGVCPGLTAARPAFLAKHPEVGARLVQVEAMAREALAKNPQLGVDAFVKRLGVTPEVAKATLARQCCGRIPSFEEQVKPDSPFSMTAKEGGLAGKLILASEVLHATKAIQSPIPAARIQEAIEPKYILEYLQGAKAR
ncbi:ABC transporter substrate-binding protein [Ramlibacter rhizophilus]|uniref:Taurine ABC transporter substrate-binding protein n=1 Tax=Ramlibacter rhizophilus TaxID=1781167 RepID=A0A4Z0BJG0_9BURK|nr:ABC transporter substrate-binding protein [Ramlibacter rhizophilus]TFY98559.1 taurine ABC transporter substrate-binding protein [Ramlibacter rhizophilus]